MWISTGSWATGNVVASVPTFIAKGAHSALESYRILSFVMPFRYTRVCRHLTRTLCFY